MNSNLIRWLRPIITKNKLFGRFRSAGHLNCGIVVLVIYGLSAPWAVAQASATAERQVDIQIGGTFSLAESGIPREASVLYRRWNYTGLGAYATIDPHRRFGLEIDGRQLIGEFIQERTFLAGPRYHKTYDRYSPFIKSLLGRGLFKFPETSGTLSFTVISLGVGTDYRLRPTLHLRADYEYQHWLGFADKVSGFPGALTPQALSIGVAYHIR